jgi:hypothetical protein
MLLALSVDVVEKQAWPALSGGGESSAGCGRRKVAEREPPAAAARLTRLLAS